LPANAAGDFGSSPSTSCASLRLCDGAPRPSVLQPRLGTRQPRQRIPCTAAAGAYSRTASLDASLWPCKNFNIEFRPRSFSELASPLLTCIILMYHPYKGAATRYMSGSYFCVLPTYTIKNRAKQQRPVYSIPNLYIWTMQYRAPIT